MSRVEKIVTVIVTINALLAVVAIVVALTAVNDRLTTEIQTRQAARLDSCYLLRGLVFVAAPPSRQAAARSYIASTPLANCVAYAKAAS